MVTSIKVFLHFDLETTVLLLGYGAKLPHNTSFAKQQQKKVPLLRKLYKFAGLHTQLWIKRSLILMRDLQQYMSEC
ncbi:MAG: hypothetical protein K2M11_10580 [Paramuribaculum sp.]|nr:hypothetical protein [Paramuribaculum sp.]